MRASASDAQNTGGPPVAVYYASASILGLAFTLVLLILAWNAAKDEQERAFARETLAAQERLSTRVRDLDRLLAQFTSLLQQGLSRPALSRLCERARRNEPALDAVAILRAVEADDHPSPQTLCGPPDGWPTREAMQSAIAAFPESRESFPLRGSREAGEQHPVLVQRWLATGHTGDVLVMLRVRASALLQGVPLPPGLALLLEMESRGPLGRVTLMERNPIIRKSGSLEPQPLSDVQSSEFTNYSVRLELRRPWTLKQFDVGMLASALILGLGVTLLMLALARARELRIRELALRNAVIEAQVADQTQELAAARDEALVAARAKSDFLARMSHEIRTPLNAILGSLEALMNMQATPEQSSLLRMCGRAGEGLLILVNDVLDLSKIEAGQLQLERVEYSPREVMEEAAGMQALQAAGKGLVLITDLAAALPLVCIGDPVRLRQVLLNLLGNALKFTQHGKVVLKAWVEDEENSTAVPVLHFQVRDTGIGIPPEKLETVFERFAQADSSTTRRFGGTGLGLSISRQLMEGMGGRLWAENPAGGGGCLQGSLPLHIVTRAPLRDVDSAERPAGVSLTGANSSQRAALQQAPVSLVAGVGTDAAARASAAEARTIGSPPASECDVPRRTLLLVEDNDDNRQLLHLFLRGHSWDITDAADGVEAVQKCAERSFDLVLMDIQMPRLDGHAATRAIRVAERTAGRRAARIIALTAHALPEELDRILEAGCDGYLTKPLKKRVLLDFLAAEQGGVHESRHTD